MKKTRKFEPSYKSYSAPRTYNHREHIDAMYKTSDWASYSKNYLEINNLCYTCGERSQAVDHVTAHKGDNFLFEKLDNHLPLCFRCHNTITAKFDRYVPQKLKEKMEWIARNRGFNQLTFRVKVLTNYR